MLTVTPIKRCDDFDDEIEDLAGNKYVETKTTDGSGGDICE